MLETGSMRQIGATKPLVSHYKIESYSNRVGDIDVNVYPHILTQRTQVEKLESKIKVDFDREFTGQSESQKLALDRIFDKATRIRKRANLPPGIGEKFDTELHDQYLKKQEHTIVESDLISGETESTDDDSDETDDLFDLEYPILEPKLKASVEEGNDSIMRRKLSAGQQMSLKQKYSNLVDTDMGQTTTESNLEQEAVSAMRMGMIF
jgi:hypothetical protein